MGIWEKINAAWKGENAADSEPVTSGDQTNAEPKETHVNEGKNYDFDDIVSLIKTKPDNVILLDVREPEEFAIVQIPGSVNMPYKSAPDALAYGDEEFKGKFGFPKPSKDQELVFFCAAGRRALGAQTKAVEEGYTNASIYSGSTNDWVAKGGDKLQF
ncbi:Rdl1 [Kluyveromyces lactis]|nr:Rdl1 [Kluyveromyces lactis]